MKASPVSPTTPRPFPLHGETVVTYASRARVEQLLASAILFPDDWERLPAAVRDEIDLLCEKSELLPRLVELRLLTPFQAEHVRAGRAQALVLGNYRLLEPLGKGGMGSVYRAVHTRLRRQVAVKVLPFSSQQDGRLLRRFHSEMQAIAQLQHPNIVAILDAGEVANPDGPDATLYYYVMEHVPGQNLEDAVREHGPLPPHRACDLVHQVANALAETSKHSLVHRDVKPSNILVTPEGQAKLLDFGVARCLRHRLTDPGIVVGTVGYMAPEQARDASAVDVRADIYGLGATLCWCLTGRGPEDALPSPSLPQGAGGDRAGRRWRTGVSPELDAVVARMTAEDPAERYPDPHALMRALLPFLRPDSAELPASLTARGTAAARAGPAGAVPGPGRHQQVLIVDDEPAVRGVCRTALQAEDRGCDEAVNGALALEAVARKRYDLILLDVDMPEVNGLQVLRALRETPPYPHLKIIMCSGRATPDEMSKMLLAGADDYVCKPFSLVQLRSRVTAALRLKEAQDRSETLNRQLLGLVTQLEQNLSARDSDLVHARSALVLALARLVEHRTAETGGHLQRLQRYTRCLAEEAAGVSVFAGRIDSHFIQMVECCAPLHDIGNITLPDHILLKPGKLTADETLSMQMHTVIGGEILRDVARHHGTSLAFLYMASDIARHHHEHYVGTGYPDALRGDEIPLAAQLVSVGDVYDALRCRRPHRPALSHSAAIKVITELSPGRFNPALLEVLQRRGAHLERIYRDLSD
jgi:response regulator RpfG family c-di-GMP phosphodiesterase